MKTLLLRNPVAARSWLRKMRAVTATLGAVLDLEVAETSAPGHATELTEAAVASGCELVVVLAGDGTVNEALQPLARTEVPLAALPGGSTNVWARRLGYPKDVEAATRTLVGGLRAGAFRRVPLGIAGHRWFACNAGFGIDAAVVRRVDRHHRRKRLFGQAAFAMSAVAALARPGSRLRAIEVKTQTSADTGPLGTVVCTVGDPFTFVGPWPLRVCSGARPEEGFGLLGLTTVDLPTVGRAVWKGLRGDASTIDQGRRWQGVYQATLTSDAPVPLHVDGVDLGDTAVVDLRFVPDALTVIAPAGRHADSSGQP